MNSNIQEKEERIIGILKPQTIRKIAASRKKLEISLKTKISIKSSIITVSGSEINNYLAEKVFEALDRNFPINVSLLLLDEDFILEDILIKEITKKKNIPIIRARIIGTEGKTLKVLGELSNSYVTLNDNTVSVIAPSENIKEITNAIISLINGSKQAKVYAYLEKNRKKKIFSKNKISDNPSKL
ncbi:hypothetical protein HYW76_02805 [Candidatus Pacearchaeota archaeon]|nr:hypothetical protein [Candidatus Pacearchaeota archaeon]